MLFLDLNNLSCSLFDLKNLSCCFLNSNNSSYCFLNLKNLSCCFSNCRIFHAASPISRIFHIVSSISTIFHVVLSISRIFHVVFSISTIFHAVSPISRIVPVVFSISTIFHVVFSISKIFHITFSISTIFRALSPISTIFHGVFSISKIFHIAVSISRIFHLVRFVKFSEKQHERFLRLEKQHERFFRLKKQCERFLRLKKQRERFFRLHEPTFGESRWDEVGWSSITFSACSVRWNPWMASSQLIRGRIAESKFRCGGSPGAEERKDGKVWGWVRSLAENVRNSTIPKILPLQDRENFEKGRKLRIHLGQCRGRKDGECLEGRYIVVWWQSRETWAQIQGGCDRRAPSCQYQGEHASQKEAELLVDGEDWWAKKQGIWTR
jgi:hypothetical protein